MVRLDANLLAATPSYLNPLKDRELDLRGKFLPFFFLLFSKINK